MKKAEFDKFADEYYDMHAAGVAISGDEPEYFSEYKMEAIAHELENSVHPDTVLDFGSGVGNSVPYLHKHLTGVDLTCLDLSARSLEIAESRFPDLARYVSFNGTKIPFPDEQFDLAYAMCVFHHIDHGQHLSLLTELRRVIRPGGSLFIFEHNPLNPLTVRVVNNCPFDENAHLIRGGEMKRRTLAAGFSVGRLRYRVFFPNILKAMRPLEKKLSWLPFGGQYYVQAVK